MWTRPKKSRTHPSPLHHPPFATTPAFLPTTSHRNNSNRWRTSSTCSSSSNKASAVNTRCHRNRECHISNNRPDRWAAGGGNRVRAGNDGDDMRDETADLVLDTRTHAFTNKPKKNSSCRVARAFGWDRGVWGVGGGCSVSSHHQTRCLGRFEGEGCHPFP